MMRWWWSVTAFVALGAGCAGAPPVPQQRFIDANADINAAQEVGADKDPQAKIHLQQARDQLESANNLNKGEPAVAERKLDNAQAEAQLAKSLARESGTRAEAEEAKSRLNAAQKDLSGTGGGQ